MMKKRYTNTEVHIRRRTVLCGVFLLCLPLLAFSQKQAGQKAEAPAVWANDEARPPHSDLNKNRSEKGLASSRAITDVRASREGAALVISILADGPLTHDDFALSNPPRLVVDFPSAENKASFFNLPINDPQVKQLRIRQFNSVPKITRMVLDLQRDSVNYKVLSGSRSVRIIFQETTGSESGSPSGTQNLIAGNSPILPGREPGADKRSARGESSTAERKQEAAPRTAPLINDLSSSEIPVSALGTGSAVPVKPRQSFPSARETPALPVPPASAPPATSSSTVITMATQDSRFTGEPLTLDLVDIPLVDFFRLMAEEGGINIVMDPEIRGTISIKVVKIPWDQIFEAALVNNGLDKQVEGNLVRIARKSTLQSEAKQQEDLKKATLLAADLQTRIKRLNYAKASTMIPTLADQKSVRGTVVVDERSNALVLTDIGTSIDRMLQLVEALDIPQPQVEIEARIVSATRDFARAIGVQFGFVQGNLERVTVGGPNTFGTIGGTRPSATPTTTFAAGNPATGRGAGSTQAGSTAGVSTGGAGNFNVNLPSTNPISGIGLSVGNIFDTFLLDAAITAGESKGLAKLISQPKVATQNNQQATVTQGLRFPVQIIANQTVTVQFQNAALTLTVTPQITQEGNIVLDLKVENNTPDFSRQVNGVPSIRTSESTTRVLVSDGGTTVIGGILIDSESNTEDKVPGLGNLPIIGNVFKRTSVSRSVQEVIFFITPRIMK